MNKFLNKYGPLVGMALVVWGIITFYSGSFNTKSPYEFRWARPAGDILADLSKSATCNFNKDANTFYSQNLSKSETDKAIRYVVSDSIVDDPITLTDLDTPQPHSRTNTGEVQLTILSSNSDTITLMSPIDASGSVAIYKLFKNDGVLVYIDSHAGFNGPVGTMDMGYCH